MIIIVVLVKSPLHQYALIDYSYDDFNMMLCHEFAEYKLVQFNMTRISHRYPNSV